MNELYKQWVDEPSITEAQRNELLSIASDEEEISDRFYTGLVFGTAGMRGVLGMGTNRMNEYTVCRATAGLAEYICSLGEEACRRGVVISYDTRHFSAEFASLAASVLAAYGVDVFLFDDARPVPVLSFTIQSTLTTTDTLFPPMQNFTILPKHFYLCVTNGLIRLYSKNL
jgi:phosphoglucomutase